MIDWTRASLCPACRSSGLSPGPLTSWLASTGWLSPCPYVGAHPLYQTHWREPSAPFTVPPEAAPPSPGLDG